MPYKIQITRSQTGRKVTQFSGKKRYETITEANNALKKAKATVAEQWRQFKEKQIKKSSLAAFRKAHLKENFGYSYKIVKA